jgi:serine/threonine protein kinase
MPPVSSAAHRRSLTLKLVDLDLGQGGHAKRGYLDEAPAAALIQQVDRQLDGWMDHARKHGPFVLKADPEDGGLERTLQVHSSHACIHLGAAVSVSQDEAKLLKATAIVHRDRDGWMQVQGGLKLAIDDTPKGRQEVAQLREHADSPYVVPTFSIMRHSHLDGLGEVRDQLYVNQPLYDGSLDQLLRDHRLSEPQQRSVIAQCIAAVAWLHNQQPAPKMHLDLKPGNFVYKLHPGGRIDVRIIDLESLTPIAGRPRNVIGTEIYDAPDLARRHLAKEFTGADPLRFPSDDLFALGVLVAEVLEMPLGVYDQLERTAITANTPGVKTPGLDTLRNVALRLMHPEPELRPQARDLLGAAERLPLGG